MPVRLMSSSQELLIFRRVPVHVEPVMVEFLIMTTLAAA